MSGGDLDGDIYCVIWDEGLKPPRSYPPMGYEAPVGQPVKGSGNHVTVEVTIVPGRNRRGETNRGA